MLANERQIGGTHYKSDYQHWDLVIMLNLGYLEGCITKYVSRWRKKDKMKDLQKGLHYLDKLIEVYDIYDKSCICTDERIQFEVSRFSGANSLIEIEQEIIFILCSYNKKSDLLIAREMLWNMIEPNKPGTPDDGGHHDKRMEGMT